MRCIRLWLFLFIFPGKGSLRGKTVEVGLDFEEGVFC